MLSNFTVLVTKSVMVVLPTLHWTLPLDALVDVISKTNAACGIDRVYGKLFVFSSILRINRLLSVSTSTTNEVRSRHLDHLDTRCICAHLQSQISRTI